MFRRDVYFVIKHTKYNSFACQCRRKKKQAKNCTGALTTLHLAMLVNASDDTQDTINTKLQRERVKSIVATSVRMWCQEVNNIFSEQIFFHIKLLFTVMMKSDKQIGCIMRRINEQISLTFWLLAAALLLSSGPPPKWIFFFSFLARPSESGVRNKANAQTANAKRMKEKNDKKRLR